MPLELLLPERCAVCGCAGEAVCRPCVAAMPRVGAVMCARCGAPTAWPVRRCRECAGRRLAFASAHAAVVYDRAVRSFVSAWKERGLRRLAAVAARIVVESLRRPPAYTLTFVPADADRGLRRGHHPAQRLACELASLWDVPARPLLARRGSAPRQRGLPLRERRRNVAGSIQATGRAPPVVTLVDDVYTSGATASEAASALRRAGARRVEVITFARAVR